LLLIAAVLTLWSMLHYLMAAWPHSLIRCLIGLTIAVTAKFFSRILTDFYQAAGIAQLVEHNLAKVGVASSSLVSRSRFPKPRIIEAFLSPAMAAR
jgi:hypothetical protein